MENCKEEPDTSLMRYGEKFLKGISINVFTVKESSKAISRTGCY